MINETDIDLLTVRIEIKKGEIWDVIGSGILWIPEESAYAYVFTAGHVVQKYLDSESEIFISYYDNEKNICSENIDKKEIRIHKDYKDEGDGKLKKCDAAILRSKNIKCNRTAYNMILLGNQNRHKNLIFNGFPNILKNRDFEMHINPFYGKYMMTLKQGNEFRYKLDIENSLDNTARNIDLVGISGSGIFINDNGYFHFLGIHTGGLGSDVNFNNVVGVGVKYFIDICKENFYDLPKTASEVNGELYQCFEGFCRDIKNEKIISVMRSIIENDFADIINLGFCDQSQKCEHQAFYHRCNTFRFHLLVVITLIKYFNIDIDISKFIDKIGNLKFKFICSDGVKEDNPPITIISFIKSLNEDYLDRKEIQEESLVVWGSKNLVRGSLEVLEDEYIKNVQDIYLSNSSNKFSILYGRGRPKKLRIIHIEEIIKYINSDNLEPLRKYMKFE